MENLTLFPLYQTTCFFIPLVAPCTPLLAFRNGSEILQAGDFSELYRKDGVYAYRRSLNVESLIVVISLSTKERPNPVSGTVVLSNYGRQESPACLSPYEALILREV